MNIQQLKQLIKQSRCGTVLDKSSALDLINELEAALEAREQLLVETLHILEITNKAVRMGAVNSSVIENHSAAIQAIQNCFEGLDALEGSFDLRDRLLTAFGDGWYEGFLKANQLSGRFESLSDSEILQMSEREGGFGRYCVLGKRLLDSSPSVDILGERIS